MATELELILKVKYEPRPETYIDESTTVSDLTPEDMAKIDEQEMKEDPGLLLEWIEGHLDNDIDIQIKVVES